MSRLTAARRMCSRSTTIRVAIVITAAGVALACRSDQAIVSLGTKLSVCHKEGATATYREISLSELPDHRSHGDYIARMEVSHSVAGGDSIHYSRITDALAAARAGRLARSEGEQAACRIYIVVAAGTFGGSTAPSSDPTTEHFPLVIDVPDISIVGAFRMKVDAAGRATGEGQTGESTILVPSPALVVVGATGSGSASQTGVSEELFVINGHPGGSKGNGAVIEGFVLQNGRAPDATVTGGQGVLTMRVSKVVIRGNKFQGSFTESVDLRASTGSVDRNYIAGVANSCDICIAGPGDYDVRNNRLAGPGGLPGILSLPTALLPVPSVVEQFVLPPTALITARITNNEVRGHLNKQVGTGIRVVAIGFAASGVASTSNVTITDNNLVGNTFGMIFDAGFPGVGSILRGDMDIRTSSNTISQSCQNDVFVSYTRHLSGLGLPSPYPSYLKNSTYSFSTDDYYSADLKGWWLSHPSGYGNTLVLDFQSLPNAMTAAYDAAKVCT